MSELITIGENPVEASRRRFLELMGASIALATGAGCTRPPTEFVMPYVTPPEQAIPGVARYYATAAVTNGIAEGVIAETHLGRPTKIEGNPRHPASLGATSVLSQASILDLYDPFRAKEVTKNNETASWDQFTVELHAALEPIRKANGRGLSLLTETVVSPTLGWQLQRVLEQFPEARWHQYDPAGPHSSRKGSLNAFGRYVNTYYRLDQANVMLSLDSDFFTYGPASTRYAHDYAFGRKVRGSNTQMNRLYVAESTLTSTGGKADHRLQLKYSDIGRFGVELAAAIGVPGVAAVSSPRFERIIGPLSQDLLANRGRSAILVGENQPPALHALVHAMNAALGNAGHAVAYTEALETRPENQIESLKTLVAEMNAGTVKILLIINGNPAYNAPNDLGFSDALARVQTSIHFGLYHDETSQHTVWSLPASHFYESWSDARAFDGTVTILQPLIERLYDSRSEVELLDLLVEMPNRASRTIVRSYWQQQAGAYDFETWWRKAVGEGMIPASSLPESQPALQPIDVGSLLASDSGIELTFRANPYLYDGRYAGNAWLQELPRHITKLTWDNAIHVSARTAERHGLRHQQIARIKVGTQYVEGAVWLSPGQPDDSIMVEFGYGRSRAGPIGTGIGFDAYRIRTTTGLWHVPNIEVSNTGATYPLATTQMNKSQHGRDLVVSQPITTYQRDPRFAQKAHPQPSYNDTLYPHWEYPHYNWGMAIDLTACVNCQACVIACQAENNIPVVGKQQVLFNRWMHWLRVDVYYEGDWSEPSARFAPIPCMHCENAPCEVVCPVQATVHSSDGLNEMIYNRCVGTRFCSNNCPYKVRRFNFLLYADWFTDQLKMQRNPDVTVRSRGVIEKCTYCVQRIREAEIRAQMENRKIQANEVKTACQQVCPTAAIVFGNINDSASEVSRMKAEPLNYGMLTELNTRPHTTYLAELRNPNPAITNYAD